MTALTGFRRSSIICMIQGERWSVSVFPPLTFCYHETYVRDTERMEAHTRRKPLVQRLESKQRVRSFPFPFFPFIPYPTTHWCPVPPEDKTNKPLCRPLPVKVKPPPPKAPAPVVGSSTWVDTKNGPSVNTPKALTGAWARKQASGNAGAKTPPPLACEFSRFTFQGNAMEG